MRLLSRSLAAAFVWAATGCGGGSTEPKVATTITLDHTSVSFTAIGQTQQLKDTVKDQGGATMTGASVSWTTSNALVATVSSSGLVTSTGAGSAQITATSGGANMSADISVNQTPSQTQQVSGNNQWADPGDPLPQPLIARVNDALGHPIAGQTVTFTAQGGTVSPTSQTTDANGQASTTFTMGPGGVGSTHQVTASVSGTGLSVIFTAGVHVSVTMYNGFKQTAPLGSPVDNRPAVRVTDTGGTPLQGISIAFQVIAGGGGVSGGTATTGADGVATVGSWTLGGTGTNQLRATVNSSGIGDDPVVFTAIATTGTSYNITIRYLTPPTAAQADAFAMAELRWETLITGDLPGGLVTVDASSCTPAMNNEFVDDLLIFADFVPIDGPNNILGQAGPCYIRASDSLPFLGIMQFDTDDMAALEQNGALDEVILHEMGHVIGFGEPLWTLKGLLADPWSSGSPGADPHFIGLQALGAFNSAGGNTYVASAKVPIENTGGEGTVNGHWRESVMGRELMTGFLDNGSNPLSAITVRSLQDLGYTVNVAAADSYTLSALLRAPGSRPMVHMNDDVFQFPIRFVHPRGGTAGKVER